MRDRYVSQFATQDECFQIFKVSLLDSSFSKHLKQLSKEMLDCSNFNAELGSNSQGFRLYHLSFLEFLNTSINILPKQVLHPFLKLPLSCFSLIWKTSKPNHLAIKYIKSSSQHLQPVIRIGSPNKIKILFPMKKLSLAYG